MLAATSTSFGAETIYPVHHHETVFVRGDGGSIQKVPWNLRPGERVHFAGFGALTEDDKNQLAQRLATVSTDQFQVGLRGDNVRAILAAIPDVNDRNDVAVKAIALGGDAAVINSQLVGIQNSAQAAQAFKVSEPVRVVWSVLATASFAASVYHGYKRNDSVGWAIVWGFFGALFPVITPVIAFAQGFGQPKKSGFGRARRYRRHTFGRTRHYRRR